MHSLHAPQGLDVRWQGVVACTTMLISDIRRHLTHMAQCEQKTMYFNQADATNYLDLASCVTAANRKQYHQVSRSGNPNCYTIQVTAISGDGLKFWTLQNQFATCRAVKQVGEGWKAQLRHGGVNLRDLPPYGRRPRFALEAGSYTDDDKAVASENIFAISDIHSAPKQSPDGSAFFGVYTSTDGMLVYYKTLATTTAGSVSANHITQVTVTDGAGTEANVPLVMVGNAVSNEFNVITNYMKARRGSPDVSIDTPGPTEGSEMLNLFSVAEEMSDDIVDGIEEYMDWKPYTTDTASNAKFDHLVLAAEVTQDTDADTFYPPASMILDVPLGLLKVTGTVNDDYRIDVLAIYEM